ncbi:hypothetical protein [Burkholderia sp. RF2-non_BP3]|uniref:hypothetical protein n=1 Tax=Burkholderia sp. RF2-non_BP3 TaxID=1637844 RepID=UPI00075695AB|nr:hypothetical protein [Burkholderia sp. RF2-non_BP3]KUY52377.1 hypothetical protein WS45_24980 [Burkholderia sp. RF2-non_BP3]
MTKSLSETLSDLRREESQLSARIASLRTESGKLKLKAAKGDATAATRRTEILNELNVAQQDLIDTRAAIAEAEPMLVVDRAKRRVDEARSITASVDTLLKRRTEMAANLDLMLVLLGALLRDLMRLHQAAGNTVRRSMPIDEAVGLDTDDLAPIRATLSVLLSAAGVEVADAFRAMESLSFGVSLHQIEKVADAVEQQNVFLRSVREGFEMRLVDHLAALEESAQQAAETPAPEAA